MVYPFGGSRSLRVTAPAKRADTGPTLARTLAVKEVSEVFSISSTPGMHWRSTSTSFSASHTACRGASIRYCPVIYMVWGSLLKDDGEGDARIAVPPPRFKSALRRSEEHTSELQSLMRISYAVFC